MMIKKFYESEKINGAYACRSLSDIAQEFYSGSIDRDPLTVYKLDTSRLDLSAAELEAIDDGADAPELFSVRGFYEADGLTFSELDALFCDLYAESVEQGRN